MDLGKVLKVTLGTRYGLKVSVCDPVRDENRSGGILKIRFA